MLPEKNLKRLRKNKAMRDLISETKVSAKDLIMPYFVIEGKNRKEPIKSMPGIARLSIDNLIKDIREAEALGIRAVLLFGVNGKKDNQAAGAYSKKGTIQEAIRGIRGEIGDIVVMTDVCLCGYTSHGHCGIIKGQGSKVKGQYLSIDNSETLKTLAKIALSHAEAGADLVAPSAMMDGQVKAMREALDEKGYQDTGILGYSAKYASSFYGPFREALDSAPQFGDRKGYQMDYRNSDEALREVRQDIEEGADIVMVKPALAYLDIIRRVNDNFNAPIAAYNVSGEYAMVKAYCRVTGDQRERSEAKPPRRGPVTSIEVEKNLVLEILTSIKRAGADLIITYHAKEAARWLKD